MMRLEELTLDPTCIRFRLALAQARRKLHLSFQIRSSTSHRILARDSDAMTQASPLRDWQGRPAIFDCQCHVRASAFVTCPIF